MISQKISFRNYIGRAMIILGNLRYFGIKLKFPRFCFISLEINTQSCVKRYVTSAKSKGNNNLKNKLPEFYRSLVMN